MAGIDSYRELLLLLKQTGQLGADWLVGKGLVPGLQTINYTSCTTITPSIESTKYNNYTQCRVSNGEQTEREDNNWTFVRTLNYTVCKRRGRCVTMTSIVRRYLDLAEEVDGKNLQELTLAVGEPVIGRPLQRSNGEINTKNAQTWKTRGDKT